MVMELAVGWANQEVAQKLEQVMLRLDGEGPPSHPRRSLFIVDAIGEPSETSLGAFVASLRERIGPLRRVSIVSLSPRSEELELVASAMIHGSSGEVLATIRFQLVPGSANELALVGIEVLDRQRGDLAVGDLGRFARGAGESAEP